MGTLVEQRSPTVSGLLGITFIEGQKTKSILDDPPGGGERGNHEMVLEDIDSSPDRRTASEFSVGRICAEALDASAEVHDGNESGATVNRGRAAAGSGSRTHSSL